MKRCPKCKHLLKWHHSRINGRYPDDGTCNVKCCMCDIPIAVLEVMVK